MTIHTQRPLDTRSIVRQMPALIGLTGRRGSDKSEAAKYLAREHGHRLVSLATSIKAMLASLSRAAGVPSEEMQRRLMDDLKYQPSPILGTTPHRHREEFWGWMRETFGAQVLEVIAERRIRGILEAGGLVVTDDTRLAEAALIRSMGGKVFEIRNPATAYAPTTHATDQAAQADGVGISGRELGIDAMTDSLELIILVSMPPQ